MVGAAGAIDPATLPGPVTHGVDAEDTDCACRAEARRARSSSGTPAMTLRKAPGCVAPKEESWESAGMCAGVCRQCKRRGSTCCMMERDCAPANTTRSPRSLMASAATVGSTDTDADGADRRLNEAPPKAAAKVPGWTRTRIREACRHDSCVLRKEKKTS